MGDIEPGNEAVSAGDHGAAKKKGQHALSGLMKSRQGNYSTTISTQLMVTGSADFTEIAL